MARQSVCDRYEMFIATAVIAAHSVAKQGFRQIDVCWFIELFANWLEFVEEYPELRVQNTQVARYIDRLVKEGLARRLSRGKHPLFRLTRPGLIEVGKRVRNPDYFMRREYFFFVYCMARAYNQLVTRLVQHEGERFSPAMRAELDELLNTDLLIDDQIAAATRELKKLDRRLDNLRSTQDLVLKLMEAGKTPLDILGEVDRLHPFGLDQHRRYSEVFSVATEKQALWELTVGNFSRVRFMWMPARNMLAHYIEELKALKNQPFEVPGMKFFMSAAEKAGAQSLARGAEMDPE
jgi:hypothetical protein